MIFVKQHDDTAQPTRRFQRDHATDPRCAAACSAGGEYCVDRVVLAGGAVHQPQDRAGGMGRRGGGATGRASGAHSTGVARVYLSQPVPDAAVLRSLPGWGISDSTADTIAVDA